MIGKTKILTGLAAIAVVGSAAVPFVASAQQSGTPSATPSAAPEHGGPRGGTALATALGVTPEALQAAIKAALESTPKPAAGDLRDEAARTAHHDAFEAALAANLGITVEALEAAQQSVAPAGGRMGPGEMGRGHGGPGGLGGPGKIRGVGNQALATALGIDVATLTAAEQAVRQELPKPDFTPGTRPDQAAMDALKAQHEAALAAKLGISVETLSAAQDKVKAEFEAQHTARGQEMFDTLLAKAVTDGKITQAKADELKAQFAQGGDAAKTASQALREALGFPGGLHRGPGGGGRPGRGPSA